MRHLNVTGRAGHAVNLGDALRPSETNLGPLTRSLCPNHRSAKVATNLQA